MTKIVRFFRFIIALVLIILSLFIKIQEEFNECIDFN